MSGPDIPSSGSQTPEGLSSLWARAVAFVRHLRERVAGTPRDCVPGDAPPAAATPIAADAPVPVAPAVPVPAPAIGSAPAIIRSREAMRASGIIETGLRQYQGLDGVAAFFGWMPNGIAREGGSPALETANVDLLVEGFGGRHRLNAGVRFMQNPVLTLGPYYGKDFINFIAMVLAIEAQGKALGIEDVFVDSILGNIDPRVLVDKPILGYRLALIEGDSNPFPHPLDDVLSPWYRRLAVRQKFLRKRPITGTKPVNYADLVALGLTFGLGSPDTRSISPATYTIFDAVASHYPRVLYGRFLSEFRRLEFDCVPPEGVNELARFRSVLLGRTLR